MANKIPLESENGAWHSFTMKIVNYSASLGAVIEQKWTDSDTSNQTHGIERLVEYCELHLRPSMCNSGNCATLDVYVRLRKFSSISCCTVSLYVFDEAGRMLRDCLTVHRPAMILRGLNYYTVPYIISGELRQQIGSGTVKIRCDFNIMMDPNLPLPLICPEPAKWNHENFGMLLKNQEFCDVRLITNDGHVINAHRSILATRSRVFQKMLKTGTKESTDGEIEIKDVEHDILQATLEYLYTGIFEESSKNLAGEILPVADKYDIATLKEICEVELFKAIDVDNAAQILVLADMCNSIDLKKTVMEFMFDNLDEIEKTPQFKRLSRELIEDLKTHSAMYVMKRHLMEVEKREALRKLRQRNQDSEWMELSV